MAAEDARQGSERARSLRARLDALLRRPLPGEPAEPPAQGAGQTAGQAAGPASVVYRRDLPRRQAASGTGTAPPGPCAPAGTLSGTEARHARCGTVWLVHTAADSVPGAAGCSAGLAACLERADGPVPSWLRAWCGAEAVQPADVVFVDLETAGLGNAPLFLIGAMAWAAGRLEVRQYLARTYAEEAAAIALFLEDHQDRRVVVTFNGKSFDLPFLRVRAAANGVPFPWEPLHFDLLHAARRAWGDLLSDCRLQTLERCICGRTRPADIPGHLIPEVYHAYVRTQDAGQMSEVLRHNVLDLITLAELTARFPGA